MTYVACFIQDYLEAVQLLLAHGKFSTFFAGEQGLGPRPQHEGYVTTEESKLATPESS